MICYIPEFILHNYEAKAISGSLMGYALLIDIADFTSIGTELQKHGKQGAEELSRFLDFVFSEPIAIVSRYGGFVSLFSGDAICAIFPKAKSESIISAVNSIQDYFQDKSTYHSILGDFALKIRQTVCWGEIYWRIYENELQNEYVFFGDTLQEIAVLSAYKEDVIFSWSLDIKSI